MADQSTADLEMADIEIDDSASLLAAEKEQVTWWEWLGFGRAAAPTPKFTKIADVDYPTLTGVRDPKHKLDIYVPHQSPENRVEGEKKPVLIHIHGGGWIRGDKGHWFYGAPATCSAFAAFNFVTCAVGYRTKVPFPGAIDDVADAIAWVHQHIGEEQYGGDVNRVFISGHSAGGHLASLATLDHRWLDRRNVPRDFIKGAVSISGIYNVSNPLESALYSWGYNKMYITPTFGTDVNFMNDHSPATHLQAVDETQPDHHVPPFLLLNAGRDFTLEKDGMAFHAIFQAKGLHSTYKTLPSESHATISRSNDTMTTVRDFLVSLLANLTTKSEAAI